MFKIFTDVDGDLCPIRIIVGILVFFMSFLLFTPRNNNSSTTQKICTNEIEIIVNGNSQKLCATYSEITIKEIK